VEDFIGEQVIQVHQPGAEAEMIIVIGFVFFYVQKGMPGIEGWFFCVLISLAPGCQVSIR